MKSSLKIAALLIVAALGSLAGCSRSHDDGPYYLSGEQNSAVYYDRPYYYHTYPYHNDRSRVIYRGDYRDGNWHRQHSGAEVDLRISK